MYLGVAGTGHSLCKGTEAGRSRKLIVAEKRLVRLVGGTGTASRATGPIWVLITQHSVLAGLHPAPSLGKMWLEHVALALALRARKVQREPGGVFGRHWQA